MGLRVMYIAVRTEFYKCVVDVYTPALGRRRCFWCLWGGEWLRWRHGVQGHAVHVIVALITLHRAPLALHILQHDMMTVPQSGRGLAWSREASMACCRMEGGTNLL